MWGDSLVIDSIQIQFNAVPFFEFPSAKTMHFLSAAEILLFASARPCSRLGTRLQWISEQVRQKGCR